MLRLQAEAEKDGADVWGVALADLSGRANYDATPETMHLFERRGGYSNTGYAFGASTWQRIAAGRNQYDSFPDGWDWAFYHLQQKEIVQQEFIVPFVPRIRNIGVVGANMDEEQYAESGLGETTVSGDLDVPFVPESARLHKGDCSGCDPSKPWAGTHPADEGSCWLCDLCRACLAERGFFS